MKRPLLILLIMGLFWSCAGQKKCNCNGNRTIASVGMIQQQMASEPLEVYQREENSSDDRVVKLTILHTNDHHGNYLKNSRSGEYGMAARKTLIDRLREEIRAEGGEVLLLSGGDINTGAPESDLLDAEPDFIGMNEIGYDAMALGNHEFDKPVDILFKQQKWAKFDFLSANVFLRSTGENAFKSYKEFDVNGLKIIVVGLTTLDAAKYTQDNRVYFKSPVEVAKEIVPELRERADILIAATHMGHYSNGIHGVNAPGDVTLAKQTGGAFDYIVGGHTQIPLPQPDNVMGTRILQAHEWGKYVGRLDLIFKNGVPQLQSYKLIPVNLKDYLGKDENGKRIYKLKPGTTEIPENPKLLAIFENFRKRVAKKLGEKVATLNGKFIGRGDNKEKEESNLGRMISHAFCSQTKANFCYVNHGGVRASLEGNVTFKDILTVMPFGNSVCSAILTGEEVVSLINGALEGTGSDPVHFWGAKFDQSGNNLQSLSIEKEGILIPVLKNGELLGGAGQEFKVTSICYLTSGKNNFPNLKEKKGYVDHKINDAAVFKQFIKGKTINAESYAAPNYINNN